MPTASAMPRTSEGVLGAPKPHPKTQHGERRAPRSLPRETGHTLCGVPGLSVLCITKLARSFELLTGQNWVAGLLSVAAASPHTCPRAAPSVSRTGSTDPTASPSSSARPPRPALGFPRRIESTGKHGIEEGLGRLGHLVESEPRQLVVAGHRCVGRRPSAERRGHVRG
jgi:hypothetical protein